MKKFSIAWAPNAESDDILLSLSLLFQPWKWFGKNSVKLLENKISTFIGKSVYSFDSGRSALYAILQALKIGENDEVLLQAFTCVALPNPILWVGAKPVYVDIDLNNLNLDIDDLEKKITKNSKAVIVQYTFGIVPDLSRIKEICKKNGLLLIEDCCHNFAQKFIVDGEEYFAGTFGDASIFSFGQEKVISATRGGFGVISNDKFRMTNSECSINRTRLRDILRGIFNPIIWKARERLGLFGELIYKFFVKIRLHELGLTNEELIGKKASHLPYSLPNTNAILGLNQFNKLERFSKHRRDISELYFKMLHATYYTLHESFQKGSIDKIAIIDKGEVNRYAKPTWLRFPIFLENAKEVLEKAEKQGLILGNWYNQPIHCKGVDFCALNYEIGSCPKVEWLCKRSVNLPTHIAVDEKEVERILSFLKIIAS